MTLVWLFASIAALLAAQAEAQTVYCNNARQQSIVAYASNFYLNMRPIDSYYLLPSMDCGIYIRGRSIISRWLITIDTISLGAFGAELSIEDGSIGGKQLIHVNGNGTKYRQIGTNSSSFNVRLTTKSAPSGLAMGVSMTVERLDSSSCPRDWYSPLSNSGYCYGVPRLVGNLTYNDAIKGCNVVLANLAMGNFDYDSIAIDLVSTGRLNATMAYWVGMYETEGNLRFLNKYNSLDMVSGSLCRSDSSCSCIAYQNGRFYRDSCSSLRPYVCYMPKGGTTSYYDLDSLISTASTVISILAVVLTIGFLLVVLISLFVIVVCCIRRVAARRQSRLQNARHATAGYFNNSAMPQAVPPPPAYTVQAAPPYTAVASGSISEAPAYVNGAFIGIGAAEKPPAYSAEWSGHQVPA